MNFLNVGLLAVAFVGFAWSQNGAMDNLVHLEAAVQQAKASYATTPSRISVSDISGAVQISVSHLSTIIFAFTGSLLEKRNRASGAA